MATCILYQNGDATISIIDIPRSIEIAQGSLPSSKRLLSSEPLDEPFPSTEPKTRKAVQRLRERSLHDLLLSKYLQFALDEVKTTFKGEWCFPRIVLPHIAESGSKKRKIDDSELEKVTVEGNNFAEEVMRDEVLKLRRGLGEAYIYYNPSEDSQVFLEDAKNRQGSLPPKSTLLLGEVVTTIPILEATGPKFDLIIMDPPWPNRSARRKKSYDISYGNAEIQELLLSLPIGNKVAENGLVAVWITNKEAFRNLLLQPGGLFDEWGITLVEEWIWLKTTIKGEPIVLLDSVWRKPYEILLIGRKAKQAPGEVKRRVIVGVPDLHSRKPNLKTLFDQFFQKDHYEALELFARNMTAGWWSWGNEVLKFQMDEYWIKDGGN